MKSKIEIEQKEKKGDTVEHCKEVRMND